MSDFPQARVVGVHPVKAEEPVYLIEIIVEASAAEFDFGQVTQPALNQPESNWQFAYDEHLHEESEEGTHFAFFFHYLDPSRPLDSPFGALALPEPTKLPPHLQQIKCDPP